MFGPEYTAGCPACSAIADGFNGFVVHLANHDVMLWAVSRAPLQKLQAFKRRMGWIFPWASSFGSDFNADFSVAVTEKQQREGGVEYLPAEPPVGGASDRDALENNARWSRQRCVDWHRRAHLHAREARHDALVLEDGVVYHTYSAYARGLDGLWGAISGSIVPEGSQ